MISNIWNRELSVSVDTHGGTLTSFFDREHDIELLWQGDKNSWDKQDIVIFPFVARLKDGYYEVDGKRYEMNIHGLCDYSDFDIRNRTSDSITLGMHYSDATLVKYPYKFDFEVIRRIEGSTLITTFVVHNLDNKTMHFGLGGHPALALPYVDNGDTIDISENYIDFGKQCDITLMDSYEGKFVEDKLFYATADRIVLSKELMQQYPTFMMIDGFPSCFDLVRADGRRVTFDIAGSKVLSLWTWPKVGAYYCIEPWLSLPDEMIPKRELADKLLINHLGAGDSFTYTFTMTAK